MKGLERLCAEVALETDRIREDAEYSSKGHYYASIPWSVAHRTLGVVSAVLSAIAAAGVLKEWSPLTIAGAATTATVFSATLAFLKPGEEADRHHRAADHYLSIRNRSRILRNIELNAQNTREEELLKKVKRLSCELDEARTSAPKIPTWAYGKAKRSIEQEKVAEYRIDKES